MHLNSKTLEKLRKLINEETEYRSGPKLVNFFREFGFIDEYTQGFPSRWQYTDEKLSKLNNTVMLETCIKKLFNPINFIGRMSDLDNYISNFNDYLIFDKKEIVRENDKILIQDITKVKVLSDREKTRDDTMPERVKSTNNFWYKKLFDSALHTVMTIMTGVVIAGIVYLLGWQ